MTDLKPIDWIPDQPDAMMPGHLRILDQTLLPTETVYNDTIDQQAIWHAIKILQVRGAPAIGVTAAMGVAAAAQEQRAGSIEDVLAAVDQSADYLATSRPTAVNLFWALERMRRVAHASAATSGNELALELVEEAIAVRDEDLAMCRAIGEHGAGLLTEGDTVLTHCNAGGLATSGYGTALAPIYVAQEQGKRVSVYADETRPLLQGARLTAWELMQAGVDVTVICDNMAAQVMKEGRIDIVFVGADRIAANGDAANKIGTYGVALLAKAHNIPFYVLAPTSTIDPGAATGADIPIEERGAEEITEGFGRRTAPEGVQVYAPAFDVTPAPLITGIITEKGVSAP
ncbi:MAG: S-methyl-5-thioribose-1-phosphate isomerase [Kiritimatiellia bacterium]|jgi:methylthioribose-1-phosphate isomerase|nr:S-methyl-5-thioribose-1-phosphate isomerase [Kiritimatiellia bacterium]MDP6811504.1 S-methyl-5-thioribose-1-phosphate isomerase [Kiritimatiellia bacterium]MDP7023764.1 S-methyl-5-thioribose-1-phosphate isomerase [Kiritimatiellia bacterium]